MLTDDEFEQLRRAVLPAADWRSFITSDPPRRISTHSQIHLAHRLNGLIKREITHRSNRWLAVATPNPNAPWRSHLHVLIDESLDTETLLTVANRSDFFGFQKGDPAAPHNPAKRYPKAIIVTQGGSWDVGYLFFKNLKYRPDALVDVSPGLIHPDTWRFRRRKDVC